MVCIQAVLCRLQIFLISMLNKLFVSKIISWLLQMQLYKKLQMVSTVNHIMAFTNVAIQKITNGLYCESFIMTFTNVAIQIQMVCTVNRFIISRCLLRRPASVSLAIFNNREGNELYGCFFSLKLVFHFLKKIIKILIWFGPKSN